MYVCMYDAAWLLSLLSCLPPPPLHPLHSNNNMMRPCHSRPVDPTPPWRHYLVITPDERLPEGAANEKQAAIPKLKPLSSTRWRNRQKNGGRGVMWQGSYVTALQTPDMNPMLVWRWATVYDVILTINQHWVNVLFAGYGSYPNFLSFPFEK